MTGGFRSRSKSGDKTPPHHDARTARGDYGDREEQRGRGRNDRGRRGESRGRGGRNDSRGGRTNDRGAGRESNRGGQRNAGGGNARQRAAREFLQAARKAGVDAPRAVAFDTLLRVETDDAFANLVLPTALRAAKLEGRDAAFATELTYGTLRALGVVDAVIETCATRGLEAMAHEVHTALRLGTYQVLYTRVEPHAAVDTTVRLVEAAGQERAKGFANGIMRTITRTRPEAWLDKLAPAGEVAALALKHAHPTWIAESFARVVGLGELEEALEGDSQRPVVHLVARPGEISAEELALMTGCDEGRYSPYAVYLEHGDPGDLEPVRQGLAGVQDEGSQLIARAVAEAAVDGPDGGRWLDLCAGPGGKAALMGALARIEGARVDAVEVSPHRADLVRKAVDGLPVDVHVADGRTPGLDAGFDRVLVDAPCSGLGALRRRPEARWRKNEADIAELAPLQFELLSSALSLVRPGGVVIYSTCSPDLRETRSIVDRAIKELGAVELPARELIPDMGDTGHELSVQMWPHRHGTDAMFFAVLRRGD